MRRRSHGLIPLPLVAAVALTVAAGCRDAVDAEAPDRAIEIVRIDVLDRDYDEPFEPGFVYARDADGAVARLVVRGAPEQRHEMEEWQERIAEDLITSFMVEREHLLAWLSEENAAGRLVLHSDEDIANAEVEGLDAEDPDARWRVQPFDGGYAVFPYSSVRSTPEVEALYLRRDRLRAEIGADVVGCFVHEELRPRGR